MDCEKNNGKMSPSCELLIEQKIQKIIIELDSRIDKNKEEIERLKNKKADDSKMTDLEKTMSALERKLDEVVRNDIASRAKIDKIFEIISEDNYEKGEIAAMVQNLVDVQHELNSEFKSLRKEVMADIASVKPIPWITQIKLFINGKWYNKIIVGTIVFVILNILVAMLSFYTGSNYNILDIINAIKGLIK